MILLPELPEYEGLWHNSLHAILQSIMQTPGLETLSTSPTLCHFPPNYNILRPVLTGCTHNTAYPSLKSQVQKENSLNQNEH